MWLVSLSICACAGIMPGWMEMLLATAASDQVPWNARFFIARLVIHVDRRHTARQQEAQASAVLCCHICQSPTSRGMFDLSMKEQNLKGGQGSVF